MFRRVISVDQKFFCSYQPIFLVTRLLGLNPYTYQKDSTIYHLRWSWSLCIFHSTLMICLISLAFYGLCLYLSNHHGFVWSSRSNYLAVIDFCELEMFGFILVISQPFNFNKMATILDMFYKMDALIPPENEDKDRKRVTVFGLIVLLVFLFGMSFDKVIIWNTAELKDHPFYFFYTIVLAFEIQYWQLVYFLNRRLQHLNSLLRKPQPTIGIVIKTHNYIHDAVTAINDAFKLQVSLIIFSCFIHIATDFFVLISALRRGDLDYIILEIFWSGIHFGRLGVVLEVCQKCEEQDQITFNLVFRLLRLDLPEHVKKELKAFGLKLNQKKIRFSSFAIDRINRFLFTKIISTITTFLIIFIQFGGL